MSVARVLLGGHPLIGIETPEYACAFNSVTLFHVCVPSEIAKETKYSFSPADIGQCLETLHNFGAGDALGCCGRRPGTLLIPCSTQDSSLDPDKGWSGPKFYRVEVEEPTSKRTKSRHT